MDKFTLLNLRRVAVFGLAIVLMIDLLLSFRSGWGLGLLMLILFPVAVAVFALLLMPREAGTLVRTPDLLLPLALLIIASHLLDWLSDPHVLGVLLNPGLPIRLWTLSLGLSVGFLLRMALDVAYATWMTCLLLEFARSGASDPSRSLPKGVAPYLRVFGLCVMGWAVVMLGTALLIGLFPLLSFAALGLMLVAGVVWNLATAAVLLVGYEYPAGLWPAFRAGMAASWSRKWNWWPLLLGQMLLLGMIFFSYRSSGGSTNLNWSVNVFWTGGYEDTCRWYEKLAAAYQTKTLPFVSTLLKLLCGALAVGVKLAIVQRLRERG